MKGPIVEVCLSMTFIHHCGGVKVLEEGVDALQLIPFAPTQGIVLQSTISPHSLMQVAELNDPLPDIDRSSDGQEKAVPMSIIVFNKLSRS